MKFFDTHCHLNIEPLFSNYQNLIESAKKNNIDYLLIPGTQYDDSLKALEIAHYHNNIYCSLGIHPYQALNQQLTNLITDLKELEKYLNNKKVVAVGEIGLDIKFNNFETQKKLFIYQLGLAKEYFRSLIIHNRGASEELIKILKKEWHPFFDNHLVFHCAEPNELILKWAKEKNLYLGFDGDLTYNFSKQEFIKKTPLDLIVIETDSPFLLPEPLRTLNKNNSHKNKKIDSFNKPENLIIIFNFLAHLLDIDPNLLADKLLKNSFNLFQIELK
jgi:TatD DNase family protein